MRIYRSRLRRGWVRARRILGGSSLFSKRFASVEALELRSMLSGSSLISDSGLYASGDDDAFASPISQLSMVQLLASSLGQRGTGATQAATPPLDDDGPPAVMALAATSESDDPPVEPLVEGVVASVILRAEDLDGNEISEIGVGQDFRLVAIVDDIRTTSPIPNQFGVFSAALRVAFDSGRISLQNPGSFAFDSFFDFASQSDLNTPGLIRAASATTEQTAPGTAPQEFFSVTLRATAGGVVNFTSAFEPFESGIVPGEFFLYGEDDLLTPENINFGGLQLNIVGLSISDVTQQETDATQNFVFSVTLSAPSSQQVTVAFTTQDGTATAGSDYTATSGTLTFAPNQTLQLITVPVLGDLVLEPSETFSVVLSNAVGAPLVDGTGLGTITDNDVPRIGISNVSKEEGDANTEMVFTVTLSDPSPTAVTVIYQTANGTATAGSDYTATSGTLTFNANSTTPQLITVNILGDDDPEQNETFEVNLSNAVGAQFDASQGEAIGTILNDDGPRLRFEQQQVSQSENETQFLFVVTLVDPADGQVTVAYTTADGTATAGSDYTATSGTLTFSDETTSQTITVLVDNDTLDEANETFTVELSDPSGATLLHSSATGTIVDNDLPPSLSFVSDDVEATEGSPIVFTVRLSEASGQPVTVQYVTLDGTATAGSDYTAIPTSTLTFAPGETEQLITVLVNQDTLNEADETFRLRLFNAQNVANTNPIEAIGTILDNDEGLPTLTVSPVEQNEGTGTAATSFVFAAELSEASGQVITVVWSTSPGTATSPADFAATSGTLTFQPGETTKAITVNVVADSTSESNETFTINLTSPQNVQLAQTSVTGTIVNDDGVPTISITGPASQNEGQQGNTPFVFTVTLSAASEAPVSVAFTTVNQTATGGSDFTATSGTLTFEPGETSAVITVLVTGDTLNEGNETFAVQLSNPLAATIDTGSATATIVNDDAEPSLSINNVSQAEGDSGSTPFVFTVTLSGSTEQSVTVRYETATGTATATDFTAASGTLTFAPGVTAQTITIQVTGDKLKEANETFSVVLSLANNATISDDTGTGTILSEAGDDITILPSTVSGTVFADSDGNGILNGREKAHAGIAVELTGTDNATGAVTMVTTTGPKGLYSFNGLGPGTYTIQFASPTEYEEGGVRIGNSGGQALASNEGYTLVINEPGDVRATGYHLVTGGLKTAFISQRLWVVSYLANNGNPPASQVSVAIGSVTSPINSGNAYNTTISGTGTAGATISVVASSGTSSTQPQTTTVATNGTWTISGINVVALPDGTVTYTATAHGFGDTTATATRTTTKDTDAPAVAITSVTNPINSSNVTNVSIIGTGTAGASVNVDVTGGAVSMELTATVDSNGNWSITGSDFTMLPDGTLTIVATATDSGNNTSTATTTTVKATAAPTVAITAVVPDPINAATQGNVTISGTGTVGAEISVVVSNGAASLPAFTRTVQSDGTWRVDNMNLTTLPDGTLTFTVTATANNNSATTTRTAIKDVVAPAVTINDIAGSISNTNQGAFQVSGTGVAGTNVTVSAVSGNTSITPVQVAVNGQGVWTATLNLTDLAEGTVTFTVSATDSAGNTATDTATAVKDTEISLAIDDVTNPIGIGNYQSTSISGTGKAGATVVVVVSDGAATVAAPPVVVSPNGDWSVTGINVGTLADGTLTYTVTISDDLGNEAEDSITAEKATLEIGSVTNPINAANAATVTISGTGQAGAAVSVLAEDEGEGSVTDGVVIAANGTWSITLDLSELADGEIAFTVTATDDDDNQIVKTATAEKDTIAPTVTIDEITDTIATPNQAAFTVSGTGEAGTNVTVSAISGVTSITPAQVIVDSEGNWTATLDLSDLADGTVTFTVTSTDAAGNTGTDSATAVKDTEVFGEIEDFSSSIGIANYQSTFIKGTGEPGATVELVVSNGEDRITPPPVVVDLDGTWSIENIDTSTLPDGTLTFTVTFRDAAGNERTDSVTSEKATLQIADVTDPINADNAGEVVIHGTGEPGATVEVVAEDENEGIVTDEVVIDENGNWTITLDLGALADGTITFTVTAIDVEDNQIVKTTTATKDTETPAVAIDAIVDPITLANQAEFVVGGTAEPNAQVTVVAGDGVNPDVTVSTTANEEGEWSVTMNLASLDDGNITFRAIAEDAAGNTSFDTEIGVKDTQTTLAIDGVTDPIGIGDYLATAISGTGEPGATVVVSVTDGGLMVFAPAVIVDIDGNWLVENIDTSTLADGTLTYTVTLTDAVGNVAEEMITAEKATLVVDEVDDINAGNAAAVTISGTGQVGATVEVVAEDNGASTVSDTVVIGEGGTWSITLDLSGLEDGEITFTVTATDADDNEIEKIVTADKDSTPPAVSIVGPSRAINSLDAPALTITGDGEPGAEVTVTASDGVLDIVQTVIIDDEGQWSATFDLTSLADGDVTFTATATDAAGNVSLPAGTDALKDTEVALAIDEFVETIGIANVGSVSISGTGEVNAVVTVVLANGPPEVELPPVVIGEDGTWSIEDIDASALRDGEITYTVIIADVAGNFKTLTVTANKTTLEFDEVGPINAANAESVTITGTGEVGATVVLVASDAVDGEVISEPTVIGEDGTWSVTFDLSELADGAITIGATATDADDNAVHRSVAAEKDTELPPVSLDPVETINAATENDVAFSGTAEPNAEIRLRIEDVLTNWVGRVLTVDETGIWQISIDLSGLEDGPLSITVTATDAAGNEAVITDQVEKDTLVPALTIDSVTGDDDSKTVTGTAEVGATVTLSISDGVDGGIWDSIVVGETGIWTFNNVDITSLAGRPITYGAIALDAAGNQGTYNFTDEEEDEDEEAEALTALDEALAGEDDWLL